MKLKHISRDSAPDLFYLDNRSLTDSYPVLKFGDIEEVQPVSPASLLIAEDFEEGRHLNAGDSQNLYPTNSELQALLKNYFSDWGRAKSLDPQSSQRVNSKYIQHNQEFVQIIDYSYASTQSNRNKTYYFPNLLSTAEESEIETLALTSGFISSDITEDSYRQTHTQDLNQSNIPSGHVESQSDISRDDLDYDDVYSLQQSILHTWGVIQTEAARRGDVFTPDINVTEGSVTKVYRYGFSPLDITAVKGTLIYRLLSEGSLIKESFEIELNKSEVNVTNPTSNVQIVVTNLNEKDSVIKILWDPNYIDSAKITNAQFFNII